MLALWREVQTGSTNTLASEREDHQRALEGPGIADTWTGQSVDWGFDPVHAGRGGANSHSLVGKCNPVPSRAVARVYSDGWVSIVGGTGESRRGSAMHRRAEESAGATASRVQVVG